jgi:hypothetical protein
MGKDMRVMTTSDDTLHPAPELSGKCHPACLLLPEMAQDEYRKLVDDIREHGQRHPIIVDADGLILDGRHRWRALEELGERYCHPETGARRAPLIMKFAGTEEQKVALATREVTVILAENPYAVPALVRFEVSQPNRCSELSEIIAGFA